MPEYYNYLQQFGNWDASPTSDFNEYLPDLRRAWNDFSSMDWFPPQIPKQNLWKRLKSQIKNMLLSS